MRELVKAPSLNNMKFLFFLLLSSLLCLQAEVNPGGEMFVKALRAGSVDTIKTLLESGFDPNFPIHGHTPLSLAMLYGRIQVVELLLSEHANPNALTTSGEAGPFGETPLQYAVQADDLRLAALLIRSGAEVNAKAPTGTTAIQSAVRAGHLDAIQLLAEHGADVNVRDAEGASPLDNTVWFGFLDTVAILLVHGARLDEPETKTGATPINEAAFKGDARIVRYLLRFHPDLGIPDKRNFTPLDNAIRMKQQDCAQLLLAAEPKERETAAFWGRTMEAAVERQETAVVEAVLARGGPANGLLPSGATALNLAAAAGATPIVSLLLSNGADPNESDRNGVSPLEAASLGGFAAIVSLLLDRGAMVNPVNEGSGTTALYAAASFGKADVVRLLLDRGASPSLCGSNRKSPYRAAVENDHREVAAAILKSGGVSGCQP